MNYSKKNHFIRTVCLLMVLIIVLSCTGCGKIAETSQKLILNGSTVKDIYPENTDGKLHVTDASNLKYVAFSGLIQLFIDSKTFSVAVKETLKNKFWYSLPVNAPKGYDNSAAAVTLTVVNGENTWHLNSQDDSVAFNNASYTANSDGVSVKYIITNNLQTAQKSKYSGSDIAFSVTVNYTLKDGSLYVTCSQKNLSGNTNAKIEYLGLLEFFGASADAKPGDFMFVPDGCGALINTAVAQPDFKPLEFKTYGQDAANSDENETANTSVIAAYGFKQGESALAVLVEQGDALSTICADRSTGKSCFNKVGVKFNITPVSKVIKGKENYCYISKNSYSGEVKLCLRFTAGSNASYSGIAAVCREQLIRDGVLSTKTVETGDYLPFNLTVVGAIKKNKSKLGFLTGLTELTTFEQAQDMVNRMKAKGINGIYMRYKGALSGGMNQNDILHAGILRSLGGIDGFTELNTYMEAQKMELYLDVNLLSSRSRRFTSDADKANSIVNEPMNIRMPNELAGFIGDKSFSRNLRPLSSIETAVIKELTDFRNMKSLGLCLNDSGKVLYSDSSDGYNRQDVSLEVAKQLSSLSTGRKIMADTGNFYSIKNADVLVNMPLNTEVKENAAYQAVPFIQLILHGIVDYSGTPINQAKNVDDMMLRYMEYGACPSYEWCYNKIIENSNDPETFYYEDWINQAVKFYTKANDALLDLRDSRMTKHTEVSDGVFCTEYNGSTLIYVNYTNKDAEVGGYTVKARDFLRIN